MIIEVSLVALVATFALVGLGITSQIVKNFRCKSTQGISLPFFILSFIVWGVWSIYGWLLDDALMGVAQGTGALMTTVILFQFFLYRKRP